MSELSKSLHDIFWINADCKSLIMTSSTRANAAIETAPGVGHIITTATTATTAAVAAVGIIHVVYHIRRT